MKKQWYRFSGAAALLLTAAALAACPVHFLLDDDHALMQLVAGYRSGTPAFYNVYNNICYSAPVSLLYRVWANIPWYPVLEILALALSAAAVFSRALRLARERGRAAAGGLLPLAVFCCAFLPNLIFLQYSAVSAALGAAAAALVLTHRDGDKKWMIVLFAVWSFLLRAETGYVTLFMLLAALAMRQLTPKKDGEARPRVYLSLILTVALCAAAFFAQLAVEQSDGVKAYTAYNAARTAFMDYPHADFDGSTVYRELGWSRTFYDLTQRWFFLDARFDTEALSAINAAAPRRGISVAGAVTTFCKTLRTTNMVRNLFVLLAGLTGALALERLLRRDGRGVLRAVIPLGCLVGAGLMLSALGRFPQHAFYACALPAAGLVTAEWADEPKGKLLSRLICAAAVLAAQLLAFSSARHVYALSHSEAYRVQEERHLAVDNYALDHADWIVVTDYSARGAGTPFTTALDAHPVNRFFWGGWYCYSPFYAAQLKANGLSALDAETFLSGKAVLLSLDPTLVALFTSYLGEAGDSVRADCVDETPHFNVYRFVRY